MDWKTKYGIYIANDTNDYKDPFLARKELLMDIHLIKSTHAFEKVTLDDSPADKSKLVSLSLETRYSKVKKNGNQVHPLMVTYKAMNLTIDSDRAGLDLVIIIDISRSMKGEKIDLVRETLLFLIEEMQEKDRLCLIKFDETSEILTNLTPMTQEFKEKFKTVVSTKLEPKGNTNIIAGLRDGFDVLLNRKTINDIAAVFLLSDGEDTCSNKMTNFDQTLYVNNAKMETKEMDYKIYTFGYGTECDENVLEFISNYKNGNFYYIKELKMIDECFIECLGFLLSVFAKNAKIEVQFAKNASLVRKYGPHWDAENSKERTSLDIGTIAIGIEKNNILEFEIIDWASITSDTFEIAKGFLTFEIDGKKYTIKATVDLTLTKDDDLGPLNAKVEENLIRVQAAEILELAARDYRTGFSDAANDRIQAFKCRAMQNSFIANDFRNNLNRILDDHDAFEDERTYKQISHTLLKQSYAPGHSGFHRMNQKQERMYSKRKLMLK